MGLHQGAPKFVAPKWYGFGRDEGEAQRTAATHREAERHTARTVSELCSAALQRMAESAQLSEAGPMAGHFIAHRYIEQIVGIADMHASPRVHALAWDARSLRWQIESLSPIATIEHALALLRDSASRINEDDSE